MREGVVHWGTRWTLVPSKLERWWSGWEKIMSNNLECVDLTKIKFAVITLTTILCDCICYIISSPGGTISTNASATTAATLGTTFGAISGATSEVTSEVASGATTGVLRRGDKRININ